MPGNATSSRRISAYMPRYLWTQKQDFGPRPRRGHAMTYDAERKRVVLFGGESHGARVNDTWEWDGQNWTQVADIGPGPRSDHAMAFDHSSKRVVLFGGNVSSGEPGGDTWERDGSDWTQPADEGRSARRTQPRRRLPPPTSGPVWRIARDDIGVCRHVGVGRHRMDARE